MNRFRFTILAVCMVLLFLGVTDLRLFFNNPEPAVVSISELEQSPAPREWLTVKDGYWNLEQAISTTGSIELEAFLVPVRSSQDPDAEIRLIVETRDPQIIELLQTDGFSFDTLAERDAFRKENHDLFFGRREVTGMLIGGLIESGNRDKLLGLARELNLPVSEDVILLSQGKEPEQFRGFFFTIVAILGTLKFVQLVRSGKRSTAELKAQ
ncbi:MAG: hypothetical protein IBX47_04820 [Desulfuromonadales bacterium]|nr:hypothetical protein [Desulfuromonadales bacterium]